ncbi:hypothetical protein ACJMK2_015628 [Sinanodonta woodiana]|uniref:Uncharacterized protein n=1 Tax=Sinanodonta woodiana TaxID=1069815 RepID=A0ABD3USG1_SINWO
MKQKNETEPLSIIPDYQFGHSLPFLDDSETGIFFKNTRSLNITQDINDTLPHISPLIPAEPIQMDIHRCVFAFQEPCNYFKDPSILNKHLIITRILANGDKERAEDSGGVLRDLFTEFWTEFYCKCTVDRNMKVHAIILAW